MVCLHALIFVKRFVVDSICLLVYDPPKALPYLQQFEACTRVPLCDLECCSAICSNRNNHALDCGAAGLLLACGGIAVLVGWPHCRTAARVRSASFV